MSTLSGEDLRKCWIANAERLARLGHFAKYSPKQRSEVLRKDYLGPCPIRGSRSPEKKLSWAMLSGHGTILTTCGISEWWAGKSARRHFPYWMKCLRSPMNPPATWKSRPDLPSFSTVVFLGARST